MNKHKTQIHRKVRRSLVRDLEVQRIVQVLLASKVQDHRHTASLALLAMTKDPLSFASLASQGVLPAFNGMLLSTDPLLVTRAVEGLANLSVDRSLQPLMVASGCAGLVSASVALSRRWPSPLRLAQPLRENAAKLLMLLSEGDDVKRQFVLAPFGDLDQAARPRGVLEMLIQDSKLALETKRKKTQQPPPLPPPSPLSNNNQNEDSNVEESHEKEHASSKDAENANTLVVAEAPLLVETKVQTEESAIVAASPKPPPPTGTPCVKALVGLIIIVFVFIFTSKYGSWEVEVASRPCNCNLKRHGGQRLRAITTGSRRRNPRIGEIAQRPRPRLQVPDQSKGSMR